MLGAAMTISQAVARVVDVSLKTNSRRATFYLKPNYVVNATQRLHPDKRSRRLELLLKLGAPNYREKKFIVRCRKAGESFPVKKVQLQWWPVKKRKKTIVYNKSLK